MDSLVEWRITDTGRRFAMRDLTPVPVQDVSKGAQPSSITDPDGNTIIFIGNFRNNY
jgi:hypothetical protein